MAESSRPRPGRVHSDALVMDTCGLLAHFNSADPAHAAVSTLLEATGARLVVSPFVVAELDYLLRRRVSVDSELAALDQLGSGAYDLAAFGEGDLQAATAIVRKYRDLQIGVADASLVVLAERYGTTGIVTLDRRDFGALRLPDGRPLQVFPDR